MDEPELGACISMPMRALPLTRRSWVTSVARSARSFSRCRTLAPSTLMPCTTCRARQQTRGLRVEVSVIITVRLKGLEHRVRI